MRTMSPSRSVCSSTAADDGCSEGSHRPATPQDAFYEDTEAGPWDPIEEERMRMRRRAASIDGEDGPARRIRAFQRTTDRRSAKSVEPVRRGWPGAAAPPWDPIEEERMGRTGGDGGPFERSTARRSWTEWEEPGWPAGAVVGSSAQRGWRWPGTTAEGERRSRSDGAVAYQRWTWVELEQSSRGAGTIGEAAWAWVETHTVWRVGYVELFDGGSAAQPEKRDLASIYDVVGLGPSGRDGPTHALVPFAAVRRLSRLDGVKLEYLERCLAARGLTLHSEYLAEPALVSYCRTVVRPPPPPPFSPAVALPPLLTRRPKGMLHPLVFAADYKGLSAAAVRAVYGGLWWTFLFLDRWGRVHELEADRGGHVVGRWDTLEDIGAVARVACAGSNFHA